MFVAPYCHNNTSQTASSQPHANQQRALCSPTPTGRRVTTPLSQTAPSPRKGDNKARLPPCSKAPSERGAHSHKASEQEERFTDANKKQVELCRLSTAAVTARHSDPLSCHCRQRIVLPALLPAWADPHVISCQDFIAYAMVPLQTVCLARADHPHVQQDLQRSPTLHHPTPTG